MNNKEIFDKLAACGFNAGNFGFSGYYKGFRLMVYISDLEIQQNRRSEQLREVLIARTRNAKETAIAEFDEIEKKIREVFEE